MQSVIGVGCCLLLCVGFLDAQKAGSPKKTSTQPQADGPSGKARRSGQKVQDAASRRRASAITLAFPRSRALLGYLERAEKPLYSSLLGQVDRIMRRRENAALRMAKEHHPELAKLILKSKRRPKVHASGMRALVADYARIMRAKQLGKEDFKAAVAEWRALSEARLLGAKVTEANEAELLPQIKELLTQAQAAKRRQLTLQIKRHEAQIKRLSRRMNQDPERLVKRQLRAIQNRIKNRSRRSGGASKRRRK